MAETAYNERVSHVESQIISKLRDRLGKCKNANEMFRVFSKFNALFVRPKVSKCIVLLLLKIFIYNKYLSQQIRGAIQEYQVQLMENVKKDIKILQESFASGYISSGAFQMSKIRDIPEIAGKQYKRFLFNIILDRSCINRSNNLGETN